jgi:predicted GH43/DUF377 family glycosyl hydrolase
MVKATRTGIQIRPDHKRVLLRPFRISDPPRIERIIARVYSLTDEEVQAEASRIGVEFDDRHLHEEEFFLKRYEDVKGYLPLDRPLSHERQLLIGAYFTHEYSLEASALFNPSMIWHPDQTGLKTGEKRFILSLRATGEGHISSITFRSGVVGPDVSIRMDPHTRYVTSPDVYANSLYEKDLFSRKLKELGYKNELSDEVLLGLEERFTLVEIENRLKEIGAEKEVRTDDINAIRALARANYDLRFLPEKHLSERVIFPFSPNELNGIEDARFVEFTDDDGSRTYYATYTAYNGRMTFPQFIETEDFQNFHISTLNGPQVQNKGMALFPRRVNGLYAMISRQDNENIYLMFSEHVHFWFEKELLLKPAYPWEFVQLGNCGSPIETDAGWLVLSHGVGPLRKYAIGAFLLDKENPRKVLGRLAEPLLAPDENEREGYVPNVVYSCGGQVFGDTLIIPYAVSDYSSSLATVPLQDVINAMV